MSRFAEWANKNMFIVIVLVMLIIWSSLFVFFWQKAEAVLRDPCSICSSRTNEKIICFKGDFPSAVKTYYPNGTVSKIRN